MRSSASTLLSVCSALAILATPLSAAAAFREDFDPSRQQVVDSPAVQDDARSDDAAVQWTNGNINVLLPYQEVTRAEFVSEVVRRIYPEGMEGCFLQLSHSNYHLLFADVTKDAPYADALCIAMRTGLIRGYADATFHPDAPINFAEASQVLSKAYGLTVDQQPGRRQAWFQPYVDTMRHYGVLPTSQDVSLPVRRADFSAMLSRLH